MAVGTIAPHTSGDAVLARRPALFLLAAVAAAACAAKTASATPLAAPEILSGFRMEGNSRLTIVFGDAAAFRRHIDQYYDLHTRMQAARDDFSRNVQLTLASLAAARDSRSAAPSAGADKRRPTCPLDAVAVSYRRAYDHGQHFHELGKALEGSHASIVELDRLGETTSLTPDYRWRVARALKLYPQVLRDFREMKLAFQEVVADELPLFGCEAQRLMARGAELLANGPLPDAAEPPGSSPGGGAVAPLGEVVPAPLVSGATFFVDNSSCPGPARVFLDGAIIGEVGPHAKAAFRASVGPHELCLLAATSTQQCGTPGTVRRIHVHDGWAIELRCD